ncbi:MAG: Uma2 family endonuclease [Caldilinea sp.]|nr:Uma2 family endonuclease [Caldilinea sp.]MDW8439093.1 hypothetical protein [Caldilineaceae bacterium]
MTENRESARLSPIAYLRQEETAATKSEYLAGELFPRTGGTANHNRIVISLCSALVEAYDLFTYG